MMPKVRKTLVKIVEAAGIKNADSFYPDIGEADLEKIKQMAAQASQQPPPEVQVQQAKLQADMQKSQAELQLKQQDQQSTLQMTAMQNEANMQLEREKMQQDAQMQMQKMQMEFQLKQEQFIAEINLKREQLIAELQLKRELAAMGQENGGTQVSSDVRTGGEPG
jgi:Skp family chaperone for outer membrane proteins